MSHFRRLLPPALAVLLLAAGTLLFQARLARCVPENRVEVLFSIPASEAQSYLDAALQDEGSPLEGLSVLREDDRWIVQGAELFTAQRLETFLSGTGLSTGEYQVLDYSWAQSTTATATQVWQTVAAFCLLVLLGHFAARLVLREWRHMRACLRTMYPAEFLQENSERLLKRLILFVPLFLAAALLLRWLWNVSYFLPAGFLPDGSLFDGQHYSQWAAAAFPQEILSPYAAQLRDTLSLACLGACVLSILWILLTILVLRLDGKKAEVSPPNGRVKPLGWSARGMAHSSVIERGELHEREQ